jgi:hypothetical protein
MGFVLGAFANQLRKATISLLRLSIGMPLDGFK